MNLLRVPAARAAADCARVLVVIPAHNEEESLGSTLDAIHAELPGTDVVVINDYSTDRTSEVARAHGAVVVELPCNLGYGGAVQTGFKYAALHDYDAVVQIDADGQHDPASAHQVLAPILAGEADVVLGSRFLGRADYAIPWPRRMGMKLFGAIATAVTHQRFSDPTSGFQALSRRAIAFFARDNYPSDFPDADTLILLALSGYRVTEVPVVMRARTAGTSMHSNLRAFYYVSKMMLSILMVLLRHLPARGRSAAVLPPDSSDDRRIAS